jgi:hypothetical protein
MEKDRMNSKTQRLKVKAQRGSGHAKYIISGGIVLK